MTGPGSQLKILNHEILQPGKRSEHMLTLHIHILQVHRSRYLIHLVVCLQFQKFPPHMDCSPTINFNSPDNGFHTVVSCMALLQVGRVRKKLDQYIWIKRRRKGCGGNKQVCGAQAHRLLFNDITNLGERYQKCDSCYPKSSTHKSLHLHMCCVCVGLKHFKVKKKIKKNQAIRCPHFQDDYMRFPSSFPLRLLYNVRMFSICSALHCLFLQPVWSQWIKYWVKRGFR